MCNVQCQRSEAIVSEEGRKKYDMRGSVDGDACNK